MAINPDKKEPLMTHIRTDQGLIIRNVIEKRKETDSTFSKGKLIREIIDLWIKGQQITLDDILP